MVKLAIMLKVFVTDGAAMVGLPEVIIIEVELVLSIVVVVVRSMVAWVLSLAT